MKKIIKIVSGSLWVMPFLVLAQAQPNATYLTSLVGQARNILDVLVVFLVALAVVWFIWNVIRYTIAQDEDKKSEAKSQMFWGIVAIAVIVSVWGLVAILQQVFGVNSNATPVGVNYLVP